VTGWAVAVVNDAEAGASSQGSLPGCLFATCRTPVGYLLGTAGTETCLGMDNTEAMKRYPDRPPRLAGLDLSPEVGGRYEMICLPAKVRGSDGAPAWAILRRMGERSPGRTVSGEVAQ